MNKKFRSVKCYKCGKMVPVKVEYATIRRINGVVQWVCTGCSDG